VTGFHFQYLSASGDANAIAAAVGTGGSSSFLQLSHSARCVRGISFTQFDANWPEARPVYDLAAVQRWRKSFVFGDPMPGRCVSSTSPPLANQDGNFSGSGMAPSICFRSALLCNRRSPARNGSAFLALPRDQEAIQTCPITYRFGTLHYYAITEASHPAQPFNAEDSIRYTEPISPLSHGWWSPLRPYRVNRSTT